LCSPRVAGPASSRMRFAPPAQRRCPHRWPEAALLHRQIEVLPGELSLPDSFRAVRGLRGADRQVGSAGAWQADASMEPPRRASRPPVPRLSAGSREHLGSAGELATAVFRAEINRGPGARRELFRDELG
jgi:hypothetical protein